MSLNRLLKNTLRRFLREHWGPTAVEYAVLLALLLFGVLSAVSLLGAFVNNSTRSTANVLPSGLGSSGESDGSGSSKSSPAKNEKPSRQRRRGRSMSLNGASKAGEHYVLAAATNPKPRYI